MLGDRQWKRLGVITAGVTLGLGAAVAVPSPATAASAHVCVAGDSDTLDMLVSINGADARIARGQCADGVNAVHASSVCNQGTFWFRSDGTSGVYPNAGWFATTGAALTISCKTNLD